MENAKTTPCPPPEPEITETMDPRESITWPRGWEAYDGRQVRVRSQVGRITFFAFEYKEGATWWGTSDMGRLPHRRVQG